MSRFTTLDAEGWANSLLGSIAEDGLADDLRDLRVELGGRPYRIFLVKTRWTGEVRGDGVEEVFYEEELLPVPKLSTLSSVALTVQSVGLDEVGELQVSEISPRYNEFQLRGLTERGEPLEDNETFYWEVAFFRHGVSTTRRRFLPRSTPYYDAIALQWSLGLVRAGRDRDSLGEP